MSDLEVKMKDLGDYWNQKMPMMAMEECAELIQAISKFERADIVIEDRNVENSLYNNLVKEMADVYISIHALMWWYTDNDSMYEVMKEDVADAIVAKLNKKY